ncbi:MAG: hypothetical protein QOH91_1611 [Mycobacterium sp.]|nr:hypothetical protein [Mycobacterium sp.]
MNLTEDEKRQTLYCCGEVARMRASLRKPVGLWLVKLIRRLELEVAVSSSRHEWGCVDSESEHEDWIGTAEAARLLGWHQRQVQRRAADLNGRKVSGKLVFREGAVRDYAEGLTNGRRAG